MNTKYTQYFIQDKQPLEEDKQPPVGTVGSQVSSGEKSGCSTGPGTTEPPRPVGQWLQGSPHPSSPQGSGGTSSPPALRRGPQT